MKKLLFILALVFSSLANAAYVPGEQGLPTACESFGMSPSASAAVNGAALQKCLSSAGSVTLRAVGTYQFSDGALSDTFCSIFLSSDTRLEIGTNVTLQYAGAKSAFCNANYKSNKSAVSSISYAYNTPTTNAITETVTTSTNHGLVTGDYVYIKNDTALQTNGIWKVVTSNGTNQFTILRYGRNGTTPFLAYGGTPIVYKANSNIVVVGDGTIDYNFYGGSAATQQMGTVLNKVSDIIWQVATKNSNKYGVYLGNSVRAHVFAPRATSPSNIIQFIGPDWDVDFEDAYGESSDDPYAITTDNKGYEAYDLTDQISVSVTRSRSSNVASIVFGSAPAFVTGDVISITNCSDTTFNASGVTATVSGSTVTYSNTGSDVGSTGDTGCYVGVKNSDGAVYGVKVRNMNASTNLTRNLLLAPGASGDIWNVDIDRLGGTAANTAPRFLANTPLSDNGAIHNLHIGSIQAVVNQTTGCLVTLGDSTGTIDFYNVVIDSIQGTAQTPGNTSGLGGTRKSGVCIGSTTGIVDLSIGTIVLDIDSTTSNTSGIEASQTTAGAKIHVGSMLINNIGAANTAIGINVLGTGTGYFTIDSIFAKASTASGGVSFFDSSGADGNYFAISRGILDCSTASTVGQMFHTGRTATINLSNVTQLGSGCRPFNTDGASKTYNITVNGLKNVNGANTQFNLVAATYNWNFTNFDCGNALVNSYGSATINLLSSIVGNSCSLDGSLINATIGAHAVGACFYNNQASYKFGVGTYCSDGVAFRPLLSGGSNAPTVHAATFGTSPSITANNGPSAFRVNVGTGGTANTGQIDLPTAPTGWNCQAADVTTPASFITSQTASTTTSASFSNYSRTTGLLIAWTASDILAVSCAPY